MAEIGWMDGHRAEGRTSALRLSLSHSHSMNDVADHPFPSVSVFHPDVSNTVIEGFKRLA